MYNISIVRLLILSKLLQHYVFDSAVLDIINIRQIFDNNIHV